ncbi:MAG: competence protein ComEA [Nonlabens sp.]|jgi:competence protein ComEA
MDGLLGAIEERVGLERADLLGVAVALLGGLIALLVALRVPLVAAVTDPALPDVAPLGVAEAAEPTELADVVVHVAGAVAAPGLVVLSAGARVADAVAAAGGATADAATAGLNLARRLVDGEQVWVPTGAEVAAGLAPAAAAMRSASAGQLPDGRVDLNWADATMLETLPGVGPVLAGRIIAYRDTNGPFGDASQLRSVPGIGEATWLQLRDLVGV